MSVASEVNFDEHIKEIFDKTSKFFTKIISSTNP